MTSVLSVETIGTVAHLVLDAPDRRNALSRPMLAALTAELGGLDDGTTGVVISGRGPGFSAGADFRELAGTSADLAYDEAVSRAREAITSAPCLVVAALEGPCMGAAADLALACDLRVAAAGSFLEVPAVRLGLLYNPAALRRAAHGLQAEAVRRVFLLGERFTAAEAQAAGLVTHVVPTGEAVKRALDLLAGIGVGQAAATAATKAFLEACLAGDESTRPGHDHVWQQRRRELLDSSARRAAVATSRARHG